MLVCVHLLCFDPLEKQYGGWHESLTFISKAVNVYLEDSLMTWIRGTITMVIVIFVTTWGCGKHPFHPWPNFSMAYKFGVILDSPPSYTGDKQKIASKFDLWMRWPKATKNVERIVH